MIIADADSRSLIEAQKQFRRSIQRVVENDDALIDENEAASMMIALNSSTLAVMIHKINELEERLTTLEADGFRRN
jgi:hypothetical protein